MTNSRPCVVVLQSIALAAVGLCSELALAQTPQADAERLRSWGVEKNDAAARATGMEQERQRLENERRQESQRQEDARRGAATGGPSYSGGGGPQAVDLRPLGKELLRLPPLPDERNVLLGRWRLEGGGPQKGIAEFGLTGRGATPGLGEMMGFLSSIESGKLLCDVSFGSGITFTPRTYSSGGAAGIAEGAIAYRSRNKQVIVAIPGDSRANPMPFTVVGPNRIVWADTCALVRVGAPGANAADNAMTAPSNARTGTANSPLPPTTAVARPQVAAVAPTSPPSRPGRPSPEVCRNTLLDQLGKVGVNQVRAMSDVRFNEAAIEGKVPNSNNLRIDLRGSACDDPRLQATLYDFDANGMLQSITYVWARPAGPAPAPIFQERVATLSRFHALPPPQSPGRLQGGTSLGRLVLQDLPERNLLLEAYAAGK